MPKPPKTKQIRPIPAVEQDDSSSTLAKRTVAMLAHILAGLKGHVDEAVEMLAAKGCDSDRASDLATLGHKISQILDAVRKAEASDAKAAGNLTKAVVMAWLRQLDQAERAGIVREAQRLDEEVSVLS